MKNQKRDLVITTVLRREGAATGIAVAVAVAVELLAYLAGLVMDHNIQSFLVSLTGIPGSLPSILTLILVFYFLITPYSDFKWAIQNGISRKIVWQGRFISMILLTLIVWFVNQLLGLLDHPFVSITASLYSLLSYFSVIITVMAIGNGFALLSRRWKWIVGIAGPVALFVLLSMSLAAIAQSMLSWGPDSVLVSLLRTSITWWMFLIIYLVVMFVLARLFNNKMQLRRD
jgi:hypothetical protein